MRPRSQTRLVGDLYCLTPGGSVPDHLQVGCGGVAGGRVRLPKLALGQCKMMPLVGRWERCSRRGLTELRRTHERAPQCEPGSAFSERLARRAYRLRSRCQCWLMAFIAAVSSALSFRI